MNTRRFQSLFRVSVFHLQLYVLIENVVICFHSSCAVLDAVSS